MILNPVFHEGELAVQEKAGVQAMAQRVGRAIKPTLPSYAAGFLAERPYVVLAAVDQQENVWASFVAGEPGFVRVLDEVTVRIANGVGRYDPLYENLRAGSQIGLIAIHLAARERMRLNGYAQLRDNGELLMAVEQAYGNCPKYIQRRRIRRAAVDGTAVPQVAISETLSEEQMGWINTADTFFVGTAHPQHGADSSHRGGNRGFVQAADAQTIIWPDYAGNMMFNTLGNIEVNPHAGLLFLDFERGRTLQLTGRAQILWNVAQIAEHRGAERLVMFTVTAVHETSQAMPYRWTFQEFSSANP